MEYPATTATIETLPNGLTLILDADATAPVISAQIWVETGSIHEDQHLGSGLSHFLEHMVFKGTRDYDADTLAHSVQAAGGHWNAYTTFERTVYYIDGPAHSLDAFLSCLTNLVFFPTLPASEFANEQDVIRREIDMGLDDADQAAMRLMLSTVYQHDPRRHPVIGHRHLFDRIQHQDLLDYHRRRYSTDRCCLVISGDFDPRAARERVSQLTAPLLPTCGPQPNIAADPPQLGPRQSRDTFPIPTSRVSLTWHSPSLNHPDAPAFDLLASILGRGRSALLYQRIREEQQLALEISAFAWSFPQLSGLFGISAECQPAQQEALTQAIHDCLQEVECKLDTDRLGSEIQKAQRQMAVSQFKTLTTASGRASDLASNWHEARDLDFTARYLQAIQRVRVDDLRRAAGQLRAEIVNTSILDPLDTPAPTRTGKGKRIAEPIRVEHLSNGLPVALLVDRRAPLFHLQASARAGLPSECVATQGINQLLAATLPKGTQSRSALEIAIALESLGASASAATGNNAFLVQAAGLSSDFSSIGELFADILIRPSLPEAVIEREKASQSAAWLDAQQEPMHVAMMALRSEAYRSVGYGLDALGSPASLQALDRPALLKHHQRHLHAANMSLAIAGDFDPDAAMDQLDSWFADLPKGEPWHAEPASFQTDRHIVRRLPKKQAVIAIGFEGASVDSDDRHALAFLQEYASDMAGPLFGRIREELGLAYQVGATQFLGYDSGLFTFYLATSPEHIDRAREELVHEIGKIARAGIPADAFERVRATALSGVALQQQSMASCARHSALDLLFGHAADSHRMLPDIYRALRADAVASVAAKIFSTAAVTATVLPEAS